ncbi:MAG: hypothetical protein J5800_09605 [Spirochaetales bacterium]|nr:hypothetical protein [Spirochaetales bacterium]
MAKDGSIRGGKRTGSGRKGRTAAQKILDGVQDRSLNVNLMEDKDMENVPAIPSWSTDEQKMIIKIGGKEYKAPPLQTHRIYANVWSFLDRIGVASDVGDHLIQLYAYEVARFIQVEQITSLIGFTVPHPTTGAPMASPYVNASMSYLKQANVIWSQISQIVRDRWDGSMKYGCYFPRTEQDDLMEQLLSSRE